MDAKLKEHVKRMIEMAKALPKMEILDCPKCDGTGKVPAFTPLIPYQWPCLAVERCPECYATGLYIKEVQTKEW